MVGFIHDIRSLDLKKLPSVSETIDWARVLVLLQASELDTDIVKDTLNVLLKYEADIEAAQPQIYDLHCQGSTIQRLRLTPMRENLHRFFRAARGAGVHVSPAESIDAMRAVTQVGISDRTVLRDALLLTLAKSQDEKLALGDCFDLFFSQPEPRQDQPEADSEDASEDADQSPSSSPASEAGEGQPPEGLGPLAQMLLSQDRNAIAAAIASASGAASLSDIRYSTQRGIFSSRILDAMGLQRLRDDLDELTATNPALAERLRRRARRACAKPSATPSRRGLRSMPARKLKTSATRSCATRRLPASSGAMSRRCAL